MSEYLQGAQAVRPRQQSICEHIQRLYPLNNELDALLNLATRVNGILGGEPPFGNAAEKEVTDENGHIRWLDQLLSQAEEKVRSLRKAIEHTIELTGTSPDPINLPKNARY